MLGSSRSGFVASICYLPTQVFVGQTAMWETDQDESRQGRLFTADLSGVILKFDGRYAPISVAILVAPQTTLTRFRTAGAGNLGPVTSTRCWSLPAR